MSKHIVKIRETAPVTHNVKRFVVEKPAGYHFISGQATDVAINQPGYEEQLRPFTFTSTANDDHLEFIIKIYSDHDGVTKKLNTVKEGDELIVHDVFGAISYHGKGLFIAGGAGITPFISIFRQLRLDGNLQGNTLIFANRSTEDVIMKDELQQLLGDNLINVFDKPSDPAVPATVLGPDLLKKHMRADTEFYYICGPDKFTEAMTGHLKGLGVEESKIIIEQ